MGKRGTKPEPTHLKLLKGNPGKRPLNKNEPKPVPVAPKAPYWMRSTAKTLWKKIGPQLERMGLLTSVDGPAFEAACENYAVWVHCAKYLTQHGLTYEVETKSGTVIQQRPEVLIGNKALLAFKAFCTEFGLTPSSRAGIDLKPTEGDIDPMEALLAGSK